MQYANLIHGGAAILFIAFGLGHIYLGTSRDGGRAGGYDPGYGR